MGSNYGVLLARLASRNEVLLLRSMVITMTFAQERNLQPLPRSNRLVIGCTYPLCTRSARPALLLEEFLKLEPGVQCRRCPAGEPIGDQLPRDSEHPGEFRAPSILLVTPFPKLTNELLGF
jgi:hypothetical protein